MLYLYKRNPIKVMIVFKIKVEIVHKISLLDILVNIPEMFLSARKPIVTDNTIITPFSIRKIKNNSGIESNRS